MDTMWNSNAVKRLYFSVGSVEAGVLTDISCMKTGHLGVEKTDRYTL